MTSEVPQIVQPVVKHVLRNFSLFGFGTQESALVQTIKELAENSIDACKLSSSSLKQVTVALSDDQASTGRLLLEVSDDGGGIDEPASVLKCFHTHKDGGSEPTVGRFGVGLSTCLIYSYTKTGCPMRIVSKVANKSTAMVADFSLNQRGDPHFVQSRTIDSAALRSGTKIRIMLPWTLGQEGLKEALSIAERYLQQLACHPFNTINLDFMVSCCGIQGTVRLAPTVLQSASPSPAEVFAEALRPRLAPRWAVGPAGTVAAEKPGLQVQVHTAVMTSPPGGQGTAQADLSTGTGLPLVLWRYAHGVPLLEGGDDCLSCASAAALRAVKWTDLGYKLRLSLETAPSEGPGDSLLSSGSQWELVPQRPELISRLQLLGPARVLVAVNVSGAQVSFSNLRKTALSKDSPALQRLIADGVVAALRGMEGRASEPVGLFVGKQEYKMQQVTERYLPSIARSVTAMVRCSQEAEAGYVLWAQRLLGVPAVPDSEGGGPHFDQEATCSAILEKLKSTITVRVSA